MTSNAWHRGVVVAFDTETTGVDVTTDRIVTACVLKIEPPALMHERNWLIDPGVEIPDGAARIHGVTTERARADGVDPAVALLEIVTVLSGVWAAGWPLIGHNLPYDLSLLDHELVRHGLGSVAAHGGPGMVIDTLALDKLIRPRARGRKLIDVASVYQIEAGIAHDAGGDAVTSARVAWRMAEAFPDHLQIDLHELMDRQQRTHLAWAEEFGAYLRSVGKADDVSRDWPYRPAAPVAVAS